MSCHGAPQCILSDSVSISIVKVVAENKLEKNRNKILHWDKIEKVKAPSSVLQDFQLKIQVPAVKAGIHRDG